MIAGVSRGRQPRPSTLTPNANHSPMQLARRGLRGEDEADDEAVQAQGLREDEDEHHADEELRLLRRRAHARVADDANRDPGGHSGEAAGEAGGEVGVAGEARVGGDATGRRRDCAMDGQSVCEWRIKGGA